MVKKVSLKNFIKDNHEILVIYGVFLAVLSFSVSNFININKVYSGRIAITSILILGLLFYVIVKEKIYEEDLSYKVTFFLILLGAVTGLIFLGITETFKTQWDTFILSATGIVFIFLGIWFGLRVNRFSEKNKKNIPYQIFIFIISIIVISLIIFYINQIDKWFGKNEYFGLFFLFFLFFFVAYGILISSRYIIKSIQKNKNFKKMFK